MGGNWRMPTQDDFHELINNTDLYLVPESGEEIKGAVTTEGAPSNSSIYFEWEQEPTGNVKGMKFYKKGNNSVYMFVPAGGVAYDGSVRGVGEGGVLWSSSLSSQNVDYAWYFVFNAGFGGVCNGNSCNGLPLRGVF